MRVLLAVAAVVLALSLPASARGNCPCDPPGPEPRAPARVWLPIVTAGAFAELGPPPVMPEPGQVDKPVRPPTTSYP